MYTCISGETDSPVANKYQIGCAITESSYISHHTAMEYYGMGDQVYYDIYVSSKTPLKSLNLMVIIIVMLLQSVISVLKRLCTVVVYG